MRNNKYFTGTNGVRYRVEFPEIIDEETMTTGVYLVSGYSYKYKRLKVYYKSCDGWNDYFGGRYGYYVNVPYPVWNDSGKPLKRTKRIYLYD